jgi:transcriptional regulator with XRE-family HTH domain
MFQLIGKEPCHTEQSMLTPDQCRMARAALKWSREDLAKRSGVAAVTIKGFELLGADSKFSTLNKLQRALEAAGVEFIDEGHTSDDGGPGVRLRAKKR